jgi:pimeloyl-ACP methyl ester carboxylesterase
MNRSSSPEVQETAALIAVDSAVIEGDLVMVKGSEGLVLFAHGSGSSRYSTRNRFVARKLHEGKLSTLLMDLLTREEERADLITGRLRFDIDLLASRVVGAVEWVKGRSQTKDLNIGAFGSSTGAAAALIAAAARPEDIKAVVSRGGRPDLAGESLPEVKAPTLLIVGGNDVPVIGINEDALARLRSEKRLEVVPGATHLFEEPGALHEVAEKAREWFQRFLSNGNARG